MFDIFIPKKIAEFHHLNLHVLWFIQAVDFEQIKFQSIFLTLSCNNLERE